MLREKIKPLTAFVIGSLSRMIFEPGGGSAENVTCVLVVSVIVTGTPLISNGLPTGTEVIHGARIPSPRTSLAGLLAGSPDVAALRESLAEWH